MINLNTELLIGILRIVVLVTILFVWVVRYDNIRNEFREYKLPKWLRDLGWGFENYLRCINKYE